MTTHTARIDYECNSEEFWDAFRANSHLLDQSCELCRRCRELLDDDVTTFTSEFDYQSFVGYASALVGWNSGPAHAKNPIVFVESDEGEDEDEDDEPKREKYITINDDIDYWGEVPENFDMGAEIAKITNAAQDAGIVVYDGCKPSQETIDAGTEIDWSTEWCYSYEWNESQWADWFRKQ